MGPYRVAVRSERATGPASSRGGAARAWCRYGDNLARHLIAGSRHLQMRLLRTLADEYGFRGLRLQTHPDPALAASARRSASVLPLVAVHIERELMQATVARGHPGLEMRLATRLRNRPGSGDAALLANLLEPTRMGTRAREPRSDLRARAAAEQARSRAEGQGWVDSTARWH